MSEAGLRGPEHVQSSDGTPIAFWSQGTGPPLLLVHGTMSDHRRWRIVDQLAQIRTVHAMDRRGRGGSGDGPVWSLEHEVDDIVTVVEAIGAAADLTVDVVAHSFGAYLAARAAGRSPRVRRLVLYEPAIVDRPQPRALVARMQEAVDGGRPELALELMMREVLHMPEAEISLLRSAPSWPARVATAATVPREESVVLQLPDDEAASVTAPTLVLRGSDSPEFLRGGAQQVAEAIPDARLVTLDGHQHVADQTDPEMFAEVVRGFLEDG